MSTTFTLFHDGSLCVGVLEIHEGGAVRAARHVFGAVPTDPELHAWFLAHGGELIDAARAAAPAAAGSRVRTTPAANPKRAAWEAARKARRAGPATAARESLKQSMSERGARHRRDKRESRNEKGEHRREARKLRQRAHHRGH